MWPFFHSPLYRPPEGDTRSPTPWRSPLFHSPSYTLPSAHVYLPRPCGTLPFQSPEYLSPFGNWRCSFRSPSRALLDMSIGQEVLLGDMRPLELEVRRLAAWTDGIASCPGRLASGSGTSPCGRDLGMGEKPPFAKGTTAFVMLADRELLLKMLIVESPLSPPSAFGGRVPGALLVGTTVGLGLGLALVVGFGGCPCGPE